VVSSKIVVELGENLLGGAANGIPRNLLTVAVADAMVVVVPTTIPEARVTLGRQLSVATQTTNNASVTIYVSDIIAEVEGVRLDSKCYDNTSTNWFSFSSNVGYINYYDHALKASAHAIHERRHNINEEKRLGK
jgi:hypothetical protein